MTTKRDVTVVYYSSNMEDSPFEEKICKSIEQAKGDLPLVSVSQKPMEFGTNICIGKVGASSQNAYRQMLLGAQTAKTRFVCTAESDCVYPPEYFQFVPPDDTCAWLADPLWILFCLKSKGRTYGLKPRGSESAMVINREVLIKRIEEILSFLDGYWGPAKANGDGWPYLLDSRAIQSRRFDAPVLTFKTDENMHRRSPYDIDSRTRELPPWGKSHDMIEKYRG